jgi:hypothetical protein
MKHLFKCLLILALSVQFYAFGQEVPLGSWKDYLSYRNGLTVTIGVNSAKQTILYCVAGSGLFSYNTSDNSIEKLNKVTGLSDVSPTVARYNSFDNILVIGYPNGNLDVLQNKTIINIPYLKIANLQGSKTINCVCFQGNYAYVGCGQGIMQIDLTQDVILNTFYIGTSGSALNVRGISICNDSIFATTDNGVYIDGINDPNINNFNSWHKANASILPAGVYTANTSMGDSVYVNWSGYYTNNGAQNSDQIFIYSNGQWSGYNNLTSKNLTISSFQTSVVNNKNYLVASTNAGLSTWDATGKQNLNIGEYTIGGTVNGTSVIDGVLDANNFAWIADKNFGLVKTNSNATAAGVYTPSGPYNNQVFSMAVNDNNLWVLPGGYDASFVPSSNFTGISSLQGMTWNYIQQPLIPYMTPPTPTTDFNCIAIDPWKPLHYFVGSWGGGLVEYNNNNLVNVWNSNNSAISNINATNYPNWRIGGVAYDTIGNLWVTSALAASKYLCVEKPNISWQAFDFSLFMPQSAVVTSVLVTQTQAKWMLFNGLGILAYQDFGSFAAPTTSNTHLITALTGNGALPDLDVTCMAVDLNGSVWVGTDQRVVVFYSPDNVFDGNHDWDAQPVYVTQNGYTQYLMQNQVTTAIAVDGANRKWIGTQSGGVFLMSADGTQQIYNFTSSNSPLLSDNIQSIVINPANGEVFIGTDKGIVSYKSTATEGLTQFGNVYAYPDPVPHGYSGPVAIKNLVTNADVKITTVNGELVYHTIALGGQAIWNGTNFDGKRVQTGVYLIFCASPDGSETHVSKLLFIN